MRWAEYVVAFSDVADADLGIMTLPEIENKSGFNEAQTRQLHGMKWIYNNRKDLVSKKWFFFVDDDTWVNVPSLLDYISWFPEALPLSFSHIYLRHERAVYNGGAGMLFSKEAFRRIAVSMFTDACPLTDVPPAPMNNDNILAACWLDQITMHKVTDQLLAEMMWCWSERLHGGPIAEPCQAMAIAEKWD
ncbi:hypothetical protein WJX77_008486 [Trebouxia sp. C0004]